MIMYRSIQQEDQAQWYSLWQAYQNFYEIVIPKEISIHTFTRFLDPQSPVHAVIAIKENQIVGFVHYIEHESTWTTQNYCYLQDLYVSASARGHGIGKALIGTVYTVAQDLNCSRVYWLTHETNMTARNLYDQVSERSGFIQYRQIF